MVFADPWAEALSLQLRAELKRKNVGYAELVTRLADMGIDENEAALSNRIRRGTYSAITLVQCLLAVGVEEFRIDRRDFPAQLVAMDHKKPK